MQWNNRSMSYDNIVFLMGIPVPRKTVFKLEQDYFSAV